MGRVASEAARLLQGKESPSYERHVFDGKEVKVANLSKVRFTGKKYRQKLYRRHTGYIGHLKEANLRAMFEKDPVRVFKLAVSGMLPKNKLRAKRLKSLIVTP